MQRLPSRMRHSMLTERFSEAQRLALERWIIARKAQNLPPSERRRRSPRAARARTTKGRQPGRSGVSGLHLHRRKVGKSFYRASVVVGPFRLSTGFTTKLEKARNFLEVLLRIRSKVCDAKVSLASSCEKDLELLEVCFKTAVKEEMAQLDSSGRREMQLNFYAKVPANYWIGKALSTPHFSATDGGLEQGFEAWKSLTLARMAIFPGRTNRYTILQHHQPEDLEAAWGRLRQKHIEVWRAAGRCPKEAAARLAALEAKHHPYYERMQRRWITSKASRNSGSTDDAGTQISAIESILAGWSPSIGKTSGSSQCRSTAQRETNQRVTVL